MDIEETIRALRALAKQVNDGDPTDAWIFAELFATLDVWLCSGGKPPSDWKRE